jgi:hypothetical protein
MYSSNYKSILLLGLFKELLKLGTIIADPNLNVARPVLLTD